MLVTITDFASQRNTDRDTVNAYIRNHKEIKDYVKKDGKNTVIDTDSEAYQLLEKQYPLPQMVQVIEDTESRKQLIEAQQIIINLQAKINEQIMLIAQAEASQMLLADKNEQLADKNEQLKAKEYELKIERERADRSELEIKKFKKSIFGFYKKYK